MKHIFCFFVAILVVVIAKVSKGQQTSHECGVSKRGTPMIINGETFPRGKFPWMVAFVLLKKHPPAYFCGGTIISSTYVLSAAHCFNGKGSDDVREPREILAYFGAHNLSKFYETERYALSPVDIILHNKWNPWTTHYDADLSLVEFEQRKITFNTYVQPICLRHLTYTPAATKAEVAGWGHDENKEYGSVPKLVKVQIQTNEMCFLETKALVDLSSNRTFCAGIKNGSGVCRGDSGGGLFIKVNKVYHILGLVSSSLTDDGICDVTKNAIYADVLKFRDWIEKITGIPVESQGIPKATTFDPSYGGIFTTASSKKSTEDPLYSGIFATAPPAYVQQGEYQPPTDSQDVFDWKLSQSLLRHKKNLNVVFSPIMVKLMLTLLAEAAGQLVASKTRTELEQVLPYNKSLFDAKEYFEKVLTSLSTKSDDYTVNFGTKVYVDEDISPLQRFSSIIEFNYLAEVEKLSFADARTAASSINGWIKTITNGLVTQNSVHNSAVLLINAMNFEGIFHAPFKKTFIAPFHRSNGRRSEMLFMARTDNYYFFFSKHLNSKILRIPYASRFSMFVVLPNGNQNLEDVVELLSSETLKNEVWHMEQKAVRVVLPKFTLENSLNLNEIVKTLGIKDIYENSATLPILARGGSSEGRLKVSNIVQTSKLTVDGKGKFDLNNEFDDEFIIYEFIADRPFLFYIEDDTTGAKLFCGMINN